MGKTRIVEEPYCSIFALATSPATLSKTIQKRKYKDVIIGGNILVFIGLRFYSDVLDAVRRRDVKIWRSAMRRIDHITKASYHQS